MADFVLAPGPFPAGTTVGVYLRSQIMAVTTGPIGGPVTSAVTAADWTTTFTGLTFGTGYWAAAQVGSVWRWVAIMTQPDPAPDMATQDELDDVQDGLQEQIDGLGGGSVTVWVPTDAALYNESGPFEGWTIADPVSFIASGNTVHVNGAVQWVGAGGGYAFPRTSIVRTGQMPAGFRPDVAWAQVIPSGVGDEIWTLFVFPSGFVGLASVHLTGAPPLGSLADFDSPTLAFNFTYPLSSVASS